MRLITLLLFIFSTLDVISQIPIDLSLGSSKIYHRSYDIDFYPGFRAEKRGNYDFISEMRGRIRLNERISISSGIGYNFYKKVDDFLSFIDDPILDCDVACFGYRDDGTVRVKYRKHIIFVPVALRFNIIPEGIINPFIYLQNRIEVVKLNNSLWQSVSTKNVSSNTYSYFLQDFWYPELTFGLELFEKLSFQMIYIFRHFDNSRKSFGIKVSYQILDIKI